MPKVVRELSPDDVRSRGQGQPKQEILEPYLHLLTPIEIGRGLEIELEEGEDQRTAKRRFTMAGKQLGKTIKWHTAPEGHLRFLVEAPKSTASPAESEEPPKRKRARGGAESTNGES